MKKIIQISYLIISLALMPLISSAKDKFNPDNANGVVYNEIKDKLGSVPEINKNIKIGAVVKAFENEYWRTLKAGMEDAVKDLKTQKDKLAISIKSAMNENDERGQLSIVKTMVTQRKDILLLSPISDGNLVPGVKSAQKHGIYTINVNDGIIDNADNYIGPRAIESGELAAEWIAKKIDYKGEVAVIVGMPKAFAARQRTKGFEDWMKNNAPNIKVIAKQNANWDRLKAKNLTEIWLKKYPNLKAIFSNNDVMALGAVEAVKKHNKNILIVGNDGIGEAYKAIKKGDLAATVDLFPYYTGRIAVEMALRKLGGQNIPKVTWVPQAIIDATNISKKAEDIIHWENHK